MNTDFYFRDKIAVTVAGDGNGLGDPLRVAFAHHPWFQLQQEGPSQLLIEVERQPVSPNRTVLSLVTGDQQLLAPDLNGSPMPKGLSYPAFRCPSSASLGLAMALKPLQQKFGIAAVHVTALLPILGSEAKISSLELLDNVIPSAPREQERLETELLALLGGQPLPISAHCVRVPLFEGTLLCVSVQLNEQVGESQVLETWRGFAGCEGRQSFPSATQIPIAYSANSLDPQPRLQGLTTRIGQLKRSSSLELSFAVVPPSPIASTIYTAEFMVTGGLIFW